MSALSSKSIKRSERSGFVLFTAAVFFIIGIPMAGLAIDVSDMYIIQSKLQAAVDAGALAGARSLARGLDTTTQAANAQATALAYTQANFPNGYMGATNRNIPAPTVVVSNFFRTVTVTGTADAPHLFMRWFGGSVSTVAARAQAVRRDVNIELVMDRSSSLSINSTGGVTNCSLLKTAAAGFITHFAEGRDYVGMLTFGTSATTNVALTQTFTTSTNTAITDMDCEGYTNSAAGLAEGYRNLAGLNQPGALNVLLFFTDGEPTAVTATFAKKTSPASPCTKWTSVANRSAAIAYYPPTSSSPTDFRGLFKAFTLGTSSDQEYYAAVPTNSNDTSASCNYQASSSNGITNDVKGIPITDYYSSSLTTSYYSGEPSVSYSGSPSLLSAASSSTAAQNFYYGAYNAAANASLRIHQGAIPAPAVNTTNCTNCAGLPNMVVFAIGLKGSGSANDTFMEYVANDPAYSSAHPNTYQAGLYVAANNAGELAQAFNRVASEILRLAQ